MGRRYELGMSLDYCPDWGVTEAVREFFQNARDESVANPENKMYFKYEDNKLYIGNKLSKLEASTLLLGVSSKRDNDKLIGTHGEGYKVATVVLARNGITVTVYNNMREIWKSKVVSSRRYGTNICVFDIEKKLFKQDNNLLFVLDGITPEMYADITEKNLYIKGDVGKFKTSDYGRVLLDDQYSGEIFIDGLYVCKRRQFKFGYDFRPDMLKLNRDRNLVDSFDLNFAISKLLTGTKDADFLTSIAKTEDAKYIYAYKYLGNDTLSQVGERLYDEYREKYGDDVYPVDSSDTFNAVNKNGFNAVLVGQSEYSLMKPFIKSLSARTTDLDTRYKIWRDSVLDYLSLSKLKEIDELWNLSKSRSGGIADIEESESV